MACSTIRCHHHCTVSSSEKLAFLVHNNVGNVGHLLSSKADASQQNSYQQQPHNRFIDTKFHPSFPIVNAMASKHLPVILLVGFLLIKSIKGRAESIEFAGYGEEKLSKVVVVGNVFCNTCLKHQFSQENRHVITGALVALECSINRKTTASVTVAESDEYGDFSVDVPSAFHPEERMNRCSVRLLNSPEDSCNAPSTTEPSKVALIANSNGVRTYTAGSLSYQPQDIPRFCYMETVRKA